MQIHWTFPVQQHLWSNIVQTFCIYNTRKKLLSGFACLLQTNTLNASSVNTLADTYDLNFHVSLVNIFIELGEIMI
jgi:hypothetical protein